MVGRLSPVRRVGPSACGPRLTARGKKSAVATSDAAPAPAPHNSAPVPDAPAGDAELRSALATMFLLSVPQWVYPAKVAPLMAVWLVGPPHVTRPTPRRRQSG